MHTFASVIVNSIDIFLRLLLLVVVASVLFPFEVMPQLLSYINSNPLHIVGLGFVYVLYYNIEKDTNVRSN